MLATLGSAGAVALAGIAPSIARAQGGAAGRVVVVGGGFGGATAARYLKLYNPSLDVTLVELAARFFTCPFSNLRTVVYVPWIKSAMVMTACVQSASRSSPKPQPT